MGKVGQKAHKKWGKKGHKPNGKLGKTLSNIKAQTKALKTIALHQPPRYSGMDLTTGWNLKAHNLLPKYFKTQMVYEDDISYPLYYAGTTLLTYRANSIYDPNYTGGGHYPYGYNTMMKFYERYKVTSSEISIQWNPTAFVNTVPYNMRIWLLPLPTLAGVGVFSHTDFLENPLGGNIGQIGQAGSIVFQNVGHAESKFSASKFFKGQNKGADTSADMGTNPLEVAYYVIGFQAGSTYITTDLTTTFRVRLKMNVTFSQPKLAGGASVAIVQSDPHYVGIDDRSGHTGTSGYPGLTGIFIPGGTGPDQ